MPGALQQSTYNPTNFALPLAMLHVNINMSGISWNSTCTALLGPDQQGLTALTTEEHCVSHRNLCEMGQTTKSGIKVRTSPHFGSREASKINFPFNFCCSWNTEPGASSPATSLSTVQPLPPNPAHPQHHHILHIFPTTGTGHQRFYQVRSHPFTFLCPHIIFG